MEFMINRLSVFLVTSSIAMVSVAQAQDAPGMSDLIGARGSSLDNAMSERGYEFSRSMGVATLYWNGNRGSCVSALVDYGRVQSIQTASASDCGRSGSSDSDDAVAETIAAAAIIGLAAALSQHHKGDDRNNNPTYNDEYERGYSSAMSGYQYSDNASEAYHSGYMAGEAERNNRRHSNSQLVSGAPAVAQNACKERGDQYWGIPAGSTVPVNVFDYGQGNYEVVVASGHYRANCSVNGRGNISDFLPQ